MADTDISITEIIYDPVNTVHDNNHEWVEISNNGLDSVSLNGWTIDDSNTNNTGVGIIPDVTLDLGDVAIFYNDNIIEDEFIALFNPAPGTILVPVDNWQPLNNNNSGDTVNLFNSQGTNIASINYTDDASPGQSLNYSVTGIYEGAGTPSRDSMGSQQHRILLWSTKLELLFGLPRALTPGQALLNGHSIITLPPIAVTYYHLPFDKHEILLVDGLHSESFHPTRSASEALSAATRAELDALFPEAAKQGEMLLACPLLSRAETTLINQ